MSHVVLVTDGDERSALAVVRSLGRAGNRVHVCAARVTSLAGASRYCAGRTAIADPLKNPDQFVRDLAEASERVGADAIFPISEASLLAVLPARDRFSARIPFPSADTFEDVCDKALVLETARSLGIPVPEQQLLTGPASGVQASPLVFPLAIKPARSVPRTGIDRTKGSVSYAQDEGELGSAIGALSPESYPVLLQEVIRGSGLAVSILIWDGKVLASFAHRRIREKPLSGGVSVLSESIPMDPGLLSKSVRLLEAFSWHGVAMVEYKVDERNGTPYLMEVNGRLWGSVQLAIDAGVDFPALLLDAAMDRNPRANREYRPGVMLRWEWGDVDNLIETVRRRRPAAWRNSPGRIAAFRRFVSAFRPGIRNEVFRLGDAGPFARESMDWCKAIIG